MLESYDDIRSRIKEPPLWFDENGVPRYEPHHPRFCPDIYAGEIVLLRIGCQACREQFSVQMSSGKYRFPGGKAEWQTFKSLEKLQTIHYGDPPIHDCSGDTMNCEDLLVIEFWERRELEWARVPELEIRLEP